MTTFGIGKTKMVDTIQQWHLTFVSFAITVGIDCKDNCPITVCEQKSNRRVKKIVFLIEKTNMNYK